MKEKLRQKYTRKRGTISLFFWVWGAISLLCLILLVAFSITQRFVVEQTFKLQIGQDVSASGQSVRGQLIDGTPSNFGSDEEFVQHLASSYGVSVAVMDEDGQAVHAVGTDNIDFGEEIGKIKDRLARVEATEDNGKFAVYQVKNYYAYVSRLSQNGHSRYLYVAKDVSYIGGVVNEVGGRTIITAAFAFIISFVVAAAVSGVFTKPIGEMKEKAKLLARGDFSVDFHGEDYGLEMTELADSLNFARDELAKTDEMQKELIANVSHDFKTPLTMIKAYASMIIEISGEDKAKREKHAQVIVDEADRLTSLVGDLLDLSKLQSGIGVLQKEIFDLSAYTKQALDGLDYLREKQGYTFEASIEDGIFVEADKGKIGQVLHNLISNAINYTGNDKKVYIRLVKEGNTAKFSVSDTGKGIPETEIKDIWDRYYRSKESHKRPVQGTGLGLSIVRRVLEMHGLPFGVESKIGVGSTFYVDFPCAMPINEDKGIDK